MRLRNILPLQFSEETLRIHGVAFATAPAYEQTRIIPIPLNSVARESRE